jgi:hypothetical protein
MKTPLLILASAILATGCAEMHEKHVQIHETIESGHAGGAYQAVNTDRYDLENREKFVLLDKGAEHSVTYSSLQDRIDDNGRLMVNANLRNRENRRIQVQVNCVFKDDAGLSVDETPFRNVFLDENAQETVKFVSASNRARKYTIRVREAR